MLAFYTVVQCRPLQLVHEAIDFVQPGDDYTFINPDTCGGHDNMKYNLYHQDHHTEHLKMTASSTSFAQTIHIQLNSSGVYCMHKECSTAAIDTCCVQIQSKK